LELEITKNSSLTLSYKNSEFTYSTSSQLITADTKPDASSNPGVYSFTPTDEKYNSFIIDSTNGNIIVPASLSVQENTKVGTVTFTPTNTNYASVNADVYLLIKKQVINGSLAFD
jgi:hypothetical protein